MDVVRSESAEEYPELVSVSFVSSRRGGDGRGCTMYVSAMDGAFASGTIARGAGGAVAAPPPWRLKSATVPAILSAGTRGREDVD